MSAVAASKLHEYAGTENGRIPPYKRWTHEP
jgi:hypothetical protein